MSIAVFLSNEILFFFLQKINCILHEKKIMYFHIEVTIVLQKNFDVSLDAVAAK